MFAVNRKFGATFCAVLVAVACHPIDSPLSSLPSQAVEQEAASRFGFELRMPIRFSSDGWETYSWEAREGAWDRYRSLRLVRRFVLVVAGPLSEVGGTLAYRTSPDGGEIVSNTKPVLQLRVYNDVPHLSFEELADTIRYVGHAVNNWTLNGTPIKEIVHSRANGYAHASGSIPSIVARGNGFLYFFDYFSVLPEAELKVQQVVGGFHLLR